jgi:hypothetical protein
LRIDSFVRAVEWGRERRFVRWVLAECLGGHRCTKKMGVAMAEQRPESGDALSRSWNLSRRDLAESGDLRRKPVARRTRS